MLYGDNFAVAIPVAVKEHTDEKPFCDHTLNPDCPCREDETAIKQLQRYVEKGLLTTAEAQRTWKGQML